ncbi:tetratricopeptide repeat protein [Streptomyces sp. NPDC002054]|uniref:tetratricopeptide repeat protein n=1 Tax=Streptomyces sp. NPDC002054 TaxID=3154663 RepID=UPI003332B276
MDNHISGGTYFAPVVQAGTVIMQDASAMSFRVPAMLPHIPDGFVDRDALRAELDRLAAGLADRSSPQVVLLDGAPGAGKSDLCVYWGRTTARERFPGGVFYADLTTAAAAGAADPAAVLESFIGELRAPRAASETVAALAARFRSLTADRPCLVVLDGVVHAGQVPALLPGHPAGMVVLTSRSPLDRLRRGGKVRPVRLTVGGLDEAACAELFRSVAELDDVPDRAGFRTVVRASAGLPGLLRLAAAQAADPLLDGFTGLVGRLAAHGSMLEALDVPEDEYYAQAARALLGDSYAVLGERGRRTFRLLGVHPTAEFAGELVDRLAGGPGVRAELREAGLLEQAGAGRFRMNPVLHTYAAELGRAETAEALPLITDWYLRRTTAAEALVSGRWRYGPHFAEPEPPAPPEPPTPLFADVEEALDALQAERHTLVGVAELCRVHDPAALCLLAESLHGFFFRRGHHSLWVQVNRLAVDAAAHTPGLGGLPLARMHFELGFALLDRGSAEDLAEARAQYDAARETARRIGHARTESSALEGLGQIAERNGDPAAALDFYAEALAALGDTEHPRGRALLAYHQGRAASAAGQHDRAASQLTEALRKFEALPKRDPHNEAKVRVRYAMARLAAGRPEEAAGPLETALAYYRGTGRPGVDGADALLVRGRLRAAQGEPEAARADWQAALDQYELLRSTRAEEARRLLGQA